MNPYALELSTASTELAHAIDALARVAASDFVAHAIALDNVEQRRAHRDAVANLWRRAMGL